MEGRAAMRGGTCVQGRGGMCVEQGVECVVGGGGSGLYEEEWSVQKDGEE